MNPVEVTEAVQHPPELGVLGEDVGDHDHGPHGAGHHNQGCVLLLEPLGEQVGQEVGAGVGV